MIHANSSSAGTIPTLSSSTTLKVTNRPSTNSSTNVTFGAKVATNIPAGIYSNTVVFSAVTNHVPNTLKMAAGRASVTTMQGLTSEICASADTWQSGEEDLVLTDTRGMVTGTGRSGYTMAARAATGGPLRSATPRTPTT